MAPSTAPPESQKQLLLSATDGFCALLNDDLTGARKELESQPESAFHLTGLGLTAFLEAALGQEEKDLSNALDLLFKAEEAAKKEHKAATSTTAAFAAKAKAKASNASSSYVGLSGLGLGGWRSSGTTDKDKEKEKDTGKDKVEEEEPNKYWWPAGMHYEVLMADAVLCQSLVHILTESYLEFMKAIYKLNRAYKAFNICSGKVFPSANFSLDGNTVQVINNLNQLWVETNPNQALAGLESTTTSLGLPTKDKKSHSASTSTVASLSSETSTQSTSAQPLSTSPSQSSGWFGRGKVAAVLGGGTANSSGTSTPNTISSTSPAPHRTLTTANLPSLGLGHKKGKGSKEKLKEHSTPVLSFSATGSTNPTYLNVGSAVAEEPGTLDNNIQALSVSAPVSRRASDSSSTKPHVVLSAEERVNLDAAGAVDVEKDALTMTAGGELGEAGTGAEVKALWEDDLFATSTISGTLFGTGLFGLVFSLLPPKLRKIISWIGFTNSNRAQSIKLLTISALTGADIHGSFAALCLVSYWQMILMLAGWQSNESELVRLTGQVLEKVEKRYPNGTLWILNRSKLARIRGDIEQSISILERNLERESDFRQARSLLMFELSWQYFTNADWQKSADTFVKVREVNSWSHATYNFMALGSLLLLPRDEQHAERKKLIRTLLEELPSLMGKKRIMGEEPPSEIFIKRKTTFYQAKHSRWLSTGRVKEGEIEWWETMKISPALEFAVFWNALPRAPRRTQEQIVQHLEALTPPPQPGFRKALNLPDTHASTHGSNPINGHHRHSPLSTGSSSNMVPPPPTNASYMATTPAVSIHDASKTDDLDTLEEVMVRALILGICYTYLGGTENWRKARRHLEDVISAGEATEDVYTSAYGYYTLAVLTLKEAYSKEQTIHEASSSNKESHIRELWATAVPAAEAPIEEIYKIGVVHHYNMRSRLESRCQILKDEMAAKRVMVGR